MGLEYRQMSESLGAGGKGEKWKFSLYKKYPALFLSAIQMSYGPCPGSGHVLPCGIGGWAPGVK